VMLVLHNLKNISFALLVANLCHVTQSIFLFLEAKHQFQHPRLKAVQQDQTALFAHPSTTSMQSHWQNMFEIVLHLLRESDVFAKQQLSIPVESSSGFLDLCLHHHIGVTSVNHQ